MKTALDGTIFVIIVYAITLIVSLLVAGIIYLLSNATKERQKN